MARRNSGQQADPQATEATESDTSSQIEEAVEAVVEGTESESTESTTEAPAAEAPAKVEDKPADLGPFQDAANKAIESTDETTGDVSKEAIDSVNKVYRDIDGVKGKNQARAWLDEQMKAAIVGKDIVKAKAFVLLKDGLSAGGGSSTPKAPADPTEAFVQRVAAQRLALSITTSTVPEGVNEGWDESADKLAGELASQVDAYRAWQDNEDEDAEAPEVSPVVRQAFRIAQGKGTGGSRAASGGPRRDVEKHMQQVFADREPGTFLTVNEIAKEASTEYGDDRPSAGAVSARLFPKGRDAYVGDTFKAVAEDGKSRGAVRI